MSTSIGQSSQLSSLLQTSTTSGAALKPDYSQTLDKQGYSPIGSPATTTTLSAAAQVAQQSQSQITTSKPPDVEKSDVTQQSPTAPVPLSALQLNSPAGSTSKAVQAYQQSSSNH